MADLDIVKRWKDGSWISTCKQWPGGWGIGTTANLATIELLKAIIAAKEVEMGDFDARVGILWLKLNAGVEGVGREEGCRLIKEFVQVDQKRRYDADFPPEMRVSGREVVSQRNAEATADRAQLERIERKLDWLHWYETATSALPPFLDWPGDLPPSVEKG